MVRSFTSRTTGLQVMVAASWLVRAAITAAGAWGGMVVSEEPATAGE